MNSFWDFIIWLFWFYVVIACIWVFITVIVDIFRVEKGQIAEHWDVMQPVPADKANKRSMY